MRNPAYESVEVGGSHCRNQGGRLRRESYDNVQLKNVAVIPSSCKPLSVALGDNDYQQPPFASLAATGNVGVPQPEFHPYEEVELKRSHTVIPTPRLGHTYGNINPKCEPPVGEKTTTIIFVDSDSPELGRFGPRRATTSACYRREVKPHAPALHTTTAPIATHRKGNLSLNTLPGEQAKASEDQAPCLIEDTGRDEDAGQDEDIGHDEGVGGDENTGRDEDVGCDEDHDCYEDMACDEVIGCDENIDHDRRSNTGDSEASACYDYI